MESKVTVELTLTEAENLLWTVEREGARLASVFGKVKEALEPKNRELKLTAQSLFDIVDLAKAENFNLSSPLYVSGEKVEFNQRTQICLVNGLISYLNRHNALNKLPYFEFTDDSEKFVAIED